MNLPPRTVVAEGFAGIGVSEDHFYAVAQFNLPGQGEAPLNVAFPKDELQSLIETAATISPDGQDDGQTQRVVSFPFRDFTVNEAEGGDLLLRIGFGAESSIRVRLTKAEMLEFAAKCQRAGSLPRKDWREPS